MTRYEILKLLHVLAAMVWVGGSVVGNVFGIRQQHASPPHQVGFARDMHFVGMKVFTPAAILVLLFGVLMVLDTPGLSFGDTWILIGLGGVVASAAIGMGYLGPRSELLVTQLETGSPEAPTTSRSIGMVAMLDTVILLLVVWAMVVKPGA